MDGVYGIVASAEKWYVMVMGYVIVKASTHGGLLRVSIPRTMVVAKGWENVRYVKVEDQWGDRIMITRVADNDESEKKDK